MDASKARSSSRTTLNRIAPIVGALIVFGTFMVNDLLRERMKDIADAISQANLRYDAWTYHKEDNDNVFRVENMLTTLGRHIEKSGNPDAGMDTIAIHADTVMIDINTKLAFLEPLIEAIPNGEERLRSRRNQLKANMDALGVITSKRIQDETGGKSPDNSTNGIIGDKEVVISGEMQDFEDVVRATGGAEREQADKLYSRYRVVSVLLYIAGWTLGLGVKFFGQGDSIEQP